MINKNVILLVEDNPDDEELTRLAFAESNVLIFLEVVRDGVEALDYLFVTGAWAGRPEGNPSLILMDLKLPKVGGLEVLRLLRADPRTKRVPVVIFTSSVEERDVVSGYELGCNSYIRKPVNFSQFTETVQQLGHYWLLLNELPTQTGAVKW